MYRQKYRQLSTLSNVLSFHLRIEAGAGGLLFDGNGGPGGPGLPLPGGAIGEGAPIGGGAPDSERKQTTKH